MRLLCSHFKCVCVFSCLREGECVSCSAHASASVCVRVISAPPSLSSVRCCNPPPPVWASYSPPQLPSFSSQLAPFSLVTASALNFHDCCLFLARSSSLLLHSLPPSLFPHSFSCHFSPSSLSLLLSSSSPKPHFPSFSFSPSPCFLPFLSCFFLCLPSSECCWRRA